jgi:hypothetical protein
MPEDPRPDFEPWWPVCVETDCRGAQVVERHCLVHATDLSGLKPGDDLDLSGVVIDSARLAEVLGRFRDHEAVWWTRAVRTSAPRRRLPKRR